jgi:hypothetical protein
MHRFQAWHYHYLVAIRLSQSLLPQVASVNFGGQLTLARGSFVGERVRKMDIVGYHVPSLIGAGATFTSIYAAFAKFDADQSDKNRDFVREWLLGLEVDDRRWAQFFKELFEKVFGSRHVSIKCVRRSSIVSAGLIGLILIYAYLKYSHSPDPRAIVYWIIVAAIVDYLTLWKTRMLLTRTRLLRNGLVAMAIVIGDALATSVIATIVLVGFPALMLARYVSPEDADQYISEFLRVISPFSPVQTEFINDVAVDRLLMLAPFFTSAWLWMYLIVAYLMRGASYLPSWLRPLSKVMDFESHPVRAIGYITATVSSAIMAAIALI